MVIWIVLALIYVPCSVLTYGITFGYFHREFSLVADKMLTTNKRMAALFAFFGPIGFLLSFFMSGFVQHGLKWK